MVAGLTGRRPGTSAGVGDHEAGGVGLRQLRCGLLQSRRKPCFTAWGEVPPGTPQSAMALLTSAGAGGPPTIWK